MDQIWMSNFFCVYIRVESVVCRMCLQYSTAKFGMLALFTRISGSLKKCFLATQNFGIVVIRNT